MYTHHQDPIVITQTMWIPVIWQTTGVQRVESLRQTFQLPERGRPDIEVWMGVDIKLDLLAVIGLLPWECIF